MNILRRLIALGSKYLLENIFTVREILDECCVITCYPLEFFAVANKVCTVAEYNVLLVEYDRLAVFVSTLEYKNCISNLCTAGINLIYIDISQNCCRSCCSCCGGISCCCGCCGSSCSCCCGGCCCSSGSSCCGGCCCSGSCSCSCGGCCCSCCGSSCSCCCGCCCSGCCSCGCCSCCGSCCCGR